MELPSVFRPAEDGGILGRPGVVDVFACLRRPDELSFAGGVFVVVETPDRATGLLLASKGIPASKDGRYLLLHNPIHLLGVEAPDLGPVRRPQWAVFRRLRREAARRSGGAGESRPRSR